LFFAIVDRAQGMALGWLALMEMRPVHGVIEIGNIVFAPRLQKTRASTEAVFMAARHVFELGYRRLEWKCNAANLPSRRAAQRYGFAYEGLFRQHMVVKGRNRDTAWFALTDEDWPARQAALSAWLEAGNFDARGRQRSALERPPNA
jgi:RimJ/RimL family protein N-acetyltransferase